MRLDEITGDDKFDRMLGGITGSDKPTTSLAGKNLEIDGNIRNLTHQIFLRLREYDDPRIYQKFIDFMRKAIAADVGPLDESAFKSTAKSPNNMKFKEFSPLHEGSIDNMVAQLTSEPRKDPNKTEKGPGRWPEGSKIQKDKEERVNAQHGVTISNPGKTVHKAGYNYSGRGYRAGADSKSRGVNKDPNLSLPAVGRQGGSFNLRRFEEATGDDKFDSMMSDIKTSTINNRNASNPDDAEYKKLLKSFDRLIPIGDSVVSFLYEYCKKYFGPERTEQNVPDQYYYVAKRYSNEYKISLSEYLTNEYYSAQPIPADVKNVKDTMDSWLIGQMAARGIGKKDFYAVWRALGLVSSFDIKNSSGENTGISFNSSHINDFFWLWESDDGLKAIQENYIKPWQGFSKWVRGCHQGYESIDNMRDVIEEIYD